MTQHTTTVIPGWDPTVVTKATRIDPLNLMATGFWLGIGICIGSFALFIFVALALAMIRAVAS